ncbi:MAG TPA: D-alanyl-D-alanine carboxypeptidase/D-alanyl-D-alanine-endopeptidase [Bryobacteraceae bacterium]|nr:D-alanyl-D-alanine carboxypeptidase/D-alanyl-D-alanine-endopeptidase [Bryobacteraceae bacterium]
MGSILLLAQCLHAATVEQRVNGLIAASKEAAGGYWGIYAVEIASGRVLLARNSRKFFVPASNAKLFATGFAFDRLGPDYRFTTRVTTDARPDASGRVRELRLVGGGDPNLSARKLPYDPAEADGNPLSPIELLADQAVASGVRVIDGDVVGDDTAYLYEPYPEGWSAEDPVWEYGAPVSALTLNDNAFRLTLQPAEEPGLPAKLIIWPSLEHLTIHNHTVTVPAGPAKVSISRLPGSQELLVRGTVFDERKNLIAVADPALYAAEALRDALLERGVLVRGTVRALHRFVADAPSPSPLSFEAALLRSAPLHQALQVMNKVSQNLHTELLLREIARLRTGVGSYRGGLKELEEFLEQIGLSTADTSLKDASGLSRLTLVTPEAVVAVLRHMYAGPHRAAWVDTLPRGGVDGTLDERFKALPRGATIQAKTGSLSHVSALAGYLTSRRGRTVAFSIIVNNYNAPASSIRPVIDRVALALGGY